MYRIVSDSFWSIGSTLLDRGGAILLTIFISRLLGAEALGVFSLILANILLIANPFSYGFSMAGSRGIAESIDNNPNQSASFVILLILAGIVLLTIFSIPFLFTPDYIATKIILQPSYSKLLKLSFILLIGELFRKTSIGFFYGLKAYKEKFISSLVILIGVLFIYPITTIIGVSGIIIYYGLLYIVAFIVGLLIIWKYFLSSLKSKFIFQPNWDDLYIFKVYVFPAFFSSLFPALIVWFLQVQLVKYGGAEQLGFFAASNQIRMAIVFFPSIFSSVLFPRMVNPKGESVKHSSKKVKYILISIVSSMVVVIFLGVGLTMVSPWLTKLFGQEFSSYNTLFIIMIWVGCLNGINQSLGSVIMSRGSMWIGFYSNAIWAILLAMMAFLWIPQHLSMGIACAMLYSYSIIIFLQMIYVIRITPEIPTLLLKILNKNKSV